MFPLTLRRGSSLSADSTCQKMHSSTFSAKAGAFAGRNKSVFHLCRSVAKDNYRFLPAVEMTEFFCFPVSAFIGVHQRLLYFTIVTNIHLCHALALITLFWLNYLIYHHLNMPMPKLQFRHISIESRLRSSLVRNPRYFFASQMSMKLFSFTFPSA